MAETTIQLYQEVKALSLKTKLFPTETARTEWLDEILPILDVEKLAAAKTLLTNAQQHRAAELTQKAAQAKELLTRVKRMVHENEEGAERAQDEEVLRRIEEEINNLTN